MIVSSALRLLVLVPFHGLEGQVLGPVHGLEACLLVNITGIHPQNKRSVICFVCSVLKVSGWSKFPYFINYVGGPGREVGPKCVSVSVYFRSVTLNHIIVIVVS